MSQADEYHQFGKKIAEFAAGKIEDEQMINKDFYKYVFLNWYANVMYGSKQKSTDKLIAYYKNETSDRSMQVIGKEDRLSTAAAIIVDCYSAVSLAYDDIHYETTLHPAAPVVSAIAGFARKKQITGLQALKALQIGLEVECRCASAIFGSGSYSSPGWYVSGIVGGLGAAAAVGNLLKLNQKQMETALGLAASRAAGLRSSHGAMSTYLVPAFAAQIGYEAANMASWDISCKLDPLTGREGLIQMIAPNAQLEKALKELGKKFLCEETECKRYPYGFIASAVIEGCIQLSSYKRVNGLKLKRLFLEVSTVAGRLASSPVPDNPFDAHTAIPYIAALIMEDENMAYMPVNEDLNISEETLGLIKKTEVIAVSELFNSQAICTAEFTDGSKKRIFSDASAQRAGRAMNDKEIRNKCLRLLSAVTGDMNGKKHIAQFLTLENAEDFSKVLLQTFEKGE